MTRKISSLLIWCAGASEPVLQVCPSERTQKLHSGFFVLVASLLAMVAMTFTIETSVGITTLSALPVGLFWGLCVFGLDRWIVSQPGKKQIWIRVLLAFLIGLFVTDAASLRLYEGEITTKLHDIQAAKVDSVKNGPAAARLKDLQGLIAKLDADSAAITSREGELSNGLTTELKFGQGNRPGGTGKVSRQLNRELKISRTRDDRQLTLNETKRAGYVKEQSDLEKSLGADVAIAEKHRDEHAGTLARSVALWDFVLDGLHHGSPLLSIMLIAKVVGIMILILIIDCSPALSKLFAPENSIYDRLLAEAGQAELDFGIAVVRERQEKIAEKLRENLE